MTVKRTTCECPKVATFLLLLAALALQELRNLLASHRIVLGVCPLVLQKLVLYVQFFSGLKNKKTRPFTLPLLSSVVLDWFMVSSYLFGGRSPAESWPSM